MKPLTEYADKVGTTSKSFITEMIKAFPNSDNSDDTEAAAKITYDLVTNLY